MANEPTRSIATSHAALRALAGAAKNAPVALIVAGEDGAVRFANERAISLFRIPPDRLDEQHLDRLLGTDLFNGIRDGRPSGERVTIELRHGPVDCELAVHRVEDGGEAYHAVWLNDVSEHVAMQQSLLQAERLSALGEIVAGVAHELNNPLTGILGYAQLLLDDQPTDRNRQRLEHVVNEAMRCQAIVQSLRGFSSHAVSEQAVHDVNRIVDNMVTLLEYQMRVDGIDVVRNFSGEELPAFVDAHALGRAILNIVHNAHQALQLFEDGPRVFSVATEADTEAIRLSFEDNGPGIAPEHLPRIFDPFFTTREFGRGVGLGLSMAYGIVREMGGRIEVESAPGRGAAFTVHLPRSK